MRIVAGKAKGRVLKTPKWTGTRPMMDKIRGALFSILGAEYVNGASVLDLYAGTGAISLEALSRGAERATLVDKNRKCTSLIAQNAEICGFSESIVAMTMAVESWLKQQPQYFDLIFFMPPYAAFDHELMNKCADWLREEGTLVAEVEGTENLEQARLSDLLLFDERKYGGTQLLFLMKRT